MAGRTSPDKPGSPTPTTARPGKMSPDSLAALTRSNRYTSMVPASDLQTWSNTFKMFDRDGGGDVDHNELGLMFRQLGFTPSDEVMRALTEEVDEDGSGSIDFEEFCLLMLRLRRAQRCPEWLNDLFCPPDEDEVDEHGKPLVAVETAVLSRPHKRGPLPGEAGPHPPLTSEQLYMVGDLLPQSPSLKSLKLAGYGELVGPFLAEEIARGIGRSNRTLTALSLACDKIGDVGAEALAAALAPGRNETLTSLDLAGNEIGEIGAVALLGALKAAISPPISPPAAEKAAADAKPKSSEKRRHKSDCTATAPPSNKSRPPLPPPPPSATATAAASASAAAAAVVAAGARRRARARARSGGRAHGSRSVGCFGGGGACSSGSQDQVPKVWSMRVCTLTQRVLAAASLPLSRCSAGPLSRASLGPKAPGAALAPPSGLSRSLSLLPADCQFVNPPRCPPPFALAGSRSRSASAAGCACCGSRTTRPSRTTSAPRSHRRCSNSTSPPSCTRKSAAAAAAAAASVGRRPRPHLLWRRRPRGSQEASRPTPRCRRRRRMPL